MRDFLTCTVSRISFELINFKSYQDKRSITHPVESKKQTLYLPHSAKLDVFGNDKTTLAPSTYSAAYI